MLRRTGVVSMTCLAAFLLSGATATQSCNPPPQPIGPSTGEIVGAEEPERDRLDELPKPDGISSEPTDLLDMLKARGIFDRFKTIV